MIRRRNCLNGSYQAGPESEIELHGSVVDSIVTKLRFSWNTNDCQTQRVRELLPRTNTGGALTTHLLLP